MKFIDEAEIEVFAGKGGSGCRHFRREKFVPYGGPDGGNGGHGGSVIVVADRSKHTLLDFKYKPQWRAKKGQPGEGSCKDGKNGDDLIIRVPLGTQIFSKDNNLELVADLIADEQQHIIAKGGRGGKGNTFFKSATNQVPEQFQPGEEGETGTFLLSLKLVADVGLIGLPNAGKSTLIARISAAKPKIADYPFTTLKPNLGVVKGKNNASFVVADIPGLIPDAHKGKGLGIQFLKHIERTRSLVHLVDISALCDSDEIQVFIDAFEQINAELEAFSEALSEKEQVVALTKIDTIPDATKAKALVAHFKDQGYQCVAISSVSGAGVDELVEILSNKAH